MVTVTSTKKNSLLFRQIQMILTRKIKVIKTRPKIKITWLTKMMRMLVMMVLLKLQIGPEI